MPSFMAGIATGRQRRPASNRIHLVDADEIYATPEAATAWDQIPLHHPVPADTYPYTRARCGAQLSHRRFDERWVAGEHVTCPRCGTPPLATQLALFADHQGA
jgi:DNA-directed RNA polymerase subunit RPC12/RpoP